MKALHPKIIDLSLDRVTRLLDGLGNPERRLPPVVHFAGTNGKGSSLAFLRAMFEAAGYRVHAYTSPHLVRFHERIRLAGDLIPESELAALLAECEAANGPTPITYFEITTAAALAAFARSPADVLLLETGLGGRLDATNVIARPALCAITPISHDHHQYLGDSLAGIAMEKAGILKPGVAAVVGAQPPAALAAIERQAAAVGAPLSRRGREWTLAQEGNETRLSMDGWSQVLPKPALAGAHQIENAALAAVAARSLAEFEIDERAIARGIETADWPARLQRLRSGPLAETLPEGWSLWLDGGHNAAAGTVLAEQARLWRDEGQPLHLVFGMLDSKSPTGFLAPLAPLIGEARSVAVPGEPASLTAQDAATAAQQIGLAATPAKNVASALQSIAAAAPAPARVLICGSLYLAGTVLRHNG